MFISIPKMMHIRKVSSLLAKGRKYFSAKSVSSAFEIGSEVALGLKHGSAIVALESTIITHGMPYPENMKTALEVENIVRKNKAIPATIAVVNGKVCIGLDESKLDELASKKTKPVKISKRDLPYVISQKLSGGTTVAATMALAYRAGIEVFVTGGIGGVHRGAETTMDISADLIELSRTPMAVVSAGVKSILDIGRTLEFLETHAVCVATYGDTKDFPAFFTPKSGFKSPVNVQTSREAAELIYSRDLISLESGILIAVPIPLSQAVQSEEIETAIAQALKETQLKNIHGKEVTPYVLQRVQQLTGGASLAANIALIKNNAHVGSLIAVELSELKKGINSCSEDNKLHPTVKVREDPGKSSGQTTNDANPTSTGRTVVIGGAALDINITCLQPDVKMNGGTFDGKVENSAGGVGRNLADCLTKLGANPFFISVVGDDDSGKILLSKMSSMDTSGIDIIPNRRTTTFAVWLDHNGNCQVVVGDMRILKDITPKQVETHADLLLQSPLVVTDGNISTDTMNYLFNFCSKNKIAVWFEPTDINHATKPATCDDWTDLLLYTSPNLNELRVMHSAIYGTHQKTHSVSSLENIDCVIEECLKLGVPLLEMNKTMTLVVTLGPLGTLVITRQKEDVPFCTSSSKQCYSENAIRAVHYTPPKPSKIVSVSGAGDCFASAMIAAIVGGLPQEDCIRAGQTAAMLSLLSHLTVPHTITRDAVLHRNDIPFSAPKPITNIIL